MTDESSSGSDSASPWSGEVPVPNAPVAFTWATTDDGSDSAPGSPGGALNGPPALHGKSGGTVDGAGSSAAGRDEDDRRRQRRLVVAGVGAVLLLTVGWLVFGRNDDAAELNAAADDSLPVATDVEDSLPTVDEPPDTDPENDVDYGQSDDDEAGDGDATSTGTGDEDGPEWSEDAIDLPQVLLDSEVPFELVALTASGEYVEIDVPSGRVDLLDFGAGLNGSVIAGASSTLLTSYVSVQESRLLRPGQAPIDVSMPERMDSGQFDPVGDEYVGVSYGNNGQPSLVRVMADGGVVTIPADDEDFSFGQRNATPDGEALIMDAGGVYRETAAGFVRISTGFLISASTNHVLVRECDEMMACGYATIDFETDERVEAILPDNAIRGFGFDSAHVSPDGRWLRYVEYDNAAPAEVLIDLLAGDRTELGSGSATPGGRVWAADSSGFFRTSLEMGFEFYVVATGETVRFGEEFGRVSSFDVRALPGNVGTPLRALTTTGLELIALTETGDVAQIDVDSGAVVTTDGPAMDSSAPLTIFPDAAGATITFYDNLPSVRFSAAERTALVIDGAGPTGPLWPGPAPGTVWQTGDDPAVLALELVDAEGNDLDARIAFDAVGSNGIVGSDGRGGVVIGPQLGGVFVLDATKLPERITSGELLAISAVVAYVRECDDSLQCGVFAVDRASGARTLVDNTGFSRAGDIGNRGVPSGQNVSPDGAIAFVRDGDDSTRCLMIDTTASRGAWTGVPCVDFASPIIWTPDSAYAVWLDEGRITVYERTTRSVRIVNTVALSAIASVPNTGAAPDVVAESTGAPATAVAPADDSGS